MTTINNLTIEQMREIVEGAPDWPVIGYCIVGNNYIFKQCEYASCSYSNLDNAWSEEYAIHFVSLNDLRTAISEHEPKMHSHLTSDALQGDDIAEHDREFKVGDLVVYHSLPHKRLFKVHNKGGDSIVIRECWDEAGARCFSENSPYVDIRHATPSEIKAGHRLEAERHG